VRVRDEDQGNGRRNDEGKSRSLLGQSAAFVGMTTKGKAKAGCRAEVPGATFKP